MKYADKFASVLTEAKNKFSATRIVNGMEIRVGWDTGYRDYTLHFPDIDMAKAAPFGISDQVIRISECEQDARKAFAEVCDAAEIVKDVYNLYRVAKRLVALI